MEIKITSQTILTNVQKIMDQSNPQRFEDFSQITTESELASFNVKLQDNEVFSKMVVILLQFAFRFLFYFLQA